MARLGVNQVVSFPSRSLPEDSGLEAELVRTRHIFQQKLDAMSLEILELKRKLQARDRLALGQGGDRSGAATTTHSRARGCDDEIPFDEIDAMLAATPLDN